MRDTLILCWLIMTIYTIVNKQWLVWIVVVSVLQEFQDWRSLWLGGVV